jgi:carbamate kinase
MRVVIALGGNALLHRGEHSDAASQIHRLSEAAALLRPLVAEHQVLLVHANATQLGVMAEDRTSHGTATEFGLDALGAQTQGLLGYWLARELDQPPNDRPTVAVLTRVSVDPADPAFARPSKAVGRIYGEAEAADLVDQRGWLMAKDQMWWRRQVASPAPVDILELPAITQLLDGGSTVICCGGGGIPVQQDEDGGWHGAEAVVDKDLTACLLATRTGADALILLTDVDAVYADYGSEHATPIRHIDSTLLRAMEFGSGPMGTKVLAACQFADASGGFAAIGAVRDIAGLLAGEAGTVIRAASSSRPTPTLATASESAR